MLAAVVLVGCGEKPTEESEIDVEGATAKAKAHAKAYHDAHKKRVDEAKAKAETGSPDAMYDLSKLTQKQESLKWCRKAAEHGHAIAQYDLGRRYVRGDGVLEDIELAYAWLNISAANGWQSAKIVKEHFGRKMTPEQISEAEELATEMIEENPKLIGG